MLLTTLLACGNDLYFATMLSAQDSVGTAINVITIFRPDRYKGVIHANGYSA
jgi:hypothetical protein